MNKTDFMQILISVQNYLKENKKSKSGFVHLKDNLKCL